ncbi:MAG TPA: hypothetical protein IAB65_03865 [Candidatus Onthocola stercorigallinarum]|nr:hypothetical protein [Candidatus Onthocola stercorigallinarum]
MDRRQKIFVLIILIIFVILVLLGTILLIDKNREFNDFVDTIKTNIYNTYIVKVEYSDTTNEDGEVESGKVVFITNPEVVDDIVDIFSNAKMDNYNALEENTDLGYTIEFLDKDNEVIIKVDNEVLTYKEDTLKVTYNQDEVVDLIKSVE